ncbi:MULTISPECIES: serine hydrolase [Curtobacterium]|uniref:serine hydrolase n=1 Tax=Curtobacterium flaccumfaciens TaxID=2035 RepID=UPI003EE8095F
MTADRPVAVASAPDALARFVAAVARIGRLLRDRGSFDGQQLVSSAWVDAMHADWVEVGSDGPFTRYGLAVWDGPGPAWRLDGRYGQYVVVDQERDAVVTVTAHEETDDHRLAELAVSCLRAA